MLSLLFELYQKKFVFAVKHFPVTVRRTYSQNLMTCLLPRSEVVSCMKLVEVVTSCEFLHFCTYTGCTYSVNMHLIQ